MSKRGIKETLLSTLVHGEEVLNNIDVMRRVNKDNISSKRVDSASNKLHPEFLTLVLNEKIDTKHGATILRFISKDGYLPPFQAGQYINVWTEIDGCLTSRPYSLSSSPKQRSYYEITVAKIPNGFVSDYLIEKLNIGEEVITSSPSGNFVYNPVFHKDKSLLLAGGSSITPFMSMVRECLESGDLRDIVLLYGSRTLDTAFYHDELLELSKEFPNFKYHLVLSEKDERWNGDFGFLDENIIKKYAPDFLTRTAYICGPTIMHDFCKEILLKLGLKQKDIRDEMFGTSPDIRKEFNYPVNDLKGDEVFKIKIGEKEIPAKANESILTALERSGVRVNVCCRCGECSLCKVKLISGKVFLAKGMLLRLADQKFGYIHSCKSYPLSDIEIEL